jgi:subtilisin family serine protease
MHRDVRRYLTMPFVFAFALAISAFGATTAEADQTSAVIVVLREGADARGVANEHASAHAARVSFIYEHALSGYAARVPAARLARLAADPRVAFISEDREVTIADHHSGELPFGVDRIEGENEATAGTGAPAIAVIDTGSGPHGDLNIAGGRNCSTGRPTNHADGNGHGTHVAGTIGAKLNGTGVVGMLPGARIYSVRVLNNAGSGSWSNVVCGIDWVTANAASLNIKVANMSLGGSGSDDGNCGNSNNDALHRAICRSVASGVTYVVAAGNSNADLKGFVPAAYDEVLSVTAVADFNGQPGGGAAATCRSDVDETAADFSNWANLASDQAHTIAAPGVCIKSTWKGGGYNTISGTSMASPHAAGTVAVCIASGSCPGTPEEIIQKIRADAKAWNDASAGAETYYGFTGDPNSPINGRYYGYLIYAGGY